MNEVFIDEVIQPADEPRRSRRDGRQDRDRHRRRRRRRSTIAVVVALALLVAAAWAVWRFAAPLIEGFGEPEQVEVTDYPGPGHGSVDVVVNQGDTGAAMAQTLVDADVVASTQAFTTAFAANPAAAGIQPGTYRLMTQMRATDAVAALLDSTNRLQTRVTIPEGFRVSQILDRLSSVTAVPIAELEAAMADTAATGLPAEAGGQYEGWLFPTTYTFEPSVTPAGMIGAMVAQTVQVLDARNVPADQRQAVLTKASLVERESPDPASSPMMARAIENRLAVGMPLQIDAAVAYGLNKPGTELTRDDISPDATDNPYNTYAHAGLPPTPIASPGEASIDAVLNPADGPWLFWVTINLDTGETRFAETFDEHLENQALLRQWQAENEG